MRFLLDEMLPPLLAVTLRSLGHDALDVRDVGLGNQTDRLILTTAADAGRVLVTENIGDFARLLDERTVAGAPSAAVVFVRRGRGPGGVIADRLGRALDCWSHAHPDPWAGAHWLRIEE